MRLHPKTHTTSQPTPRRRRRRPKIRSVKSPRLVLHADCTTCGPIGLGVSDHASIPGLALEHVAATSHVIVLNGTADLPDPE